MTSQCEAGNERNGGIKEEKKMTQEQSVELTLNFDLGPRKLWALQLVCLQNIICSQNHTHSFLGHLTLMHMCNSMWYQDKGLNLMQFPSKGCPWPTLWHKLSSAIKSWFSLCRKAIYFNFSKVMSFWHFSSRTYCLSLSWGIRCSWWYVP